MLSAGRAIRGSKKRNKDRGTRRVINPSFDASVIVNTSPNLLDLMSATPSPSAAGATNTVYSSTPTQQLSLFAEVFSGNTDDLIWPLQLIDPRDKEQFAVLYPLLGKLPHPVMFYLNELIFPEVLAYQGLKLSACGQELGGDMLFGRRIGFSGTPSDILPRELGGCHYERGSDGQVVHYLTSPRVVGHRDLPSGWNAKSILDVIARVRLSTFTTTIDLYPYLCLYLYLFIFSLLIYACICMYITELPSISRTDRYRSPHHWYEQQRRRRLPSHLWTPRHERRRFPR